MNKTVLIVVVIAALGGLVYLMTQKKIVASTAPYVPPKGTSPQSNLISQVGSFLGTSQGQALEGAAADALSSWLDG